MGEPSSIRTLQRFAIRAVLGGIGFAIGAAGIIGTAFMVFRSANPAFFMERESAQATLDSMGFIPASSSSPDTNTWSSSITTC